MIRKWSSLLQDTCRYCWSDENYERGIYEKKCYEGEELAILMYNIIKSSLNEEGIPQDRKRANTACITKETEKIC